MRAIFLCACFVALVACATTSPTLADWSQGTPELKHAGPLAFAPDGVLLVGDSLTAAVVAIQTEDASGEGASGEKREINVEGVNQRIADMMGNPVEETVINDLAVNPLSGHVYLSVSRGRGPDAMPVLFKIDSKGTISELELKNVKFAVATFENAPASGSDRRGQNPRMSSITDIQYEDGKVIVAGLSNEEFASKLRVFAYPFNGDNSSTSIEVYHGAHGALETRSPVRTFITYENTVLAAYTCTPLVTIPVSDLSDHAQASGNQASGNKVRGKTIAELGNRNTPLDMIIYTKAGQDYLLMANTARGVMKIKLDKSEMAAAESINSKIDGTAGVSFETLEYKNVVQMDKLTEDHAILLVADSPEKMNLQTIQLP